MALTKFVRNVSDLSDDGGYKFRFHCDRCNDGVESQYISSSANILKTGLEVFQALRGFGGFGRAVDGIDRGLRGKERDAAYERAIGEAQSHFHKCTHCGVWTCPHCWNESVGLCEGCAPDAHEASAKEAARIALDKKVEQVRSRQETTANLASCPLCGGETGGGKFCMSCGGPVGQKTCPGCKTQLAPTAKFCGECGTKTG